MIKYVAMACFAKELNQAIWGKLATAVRRVREEGLEWRGEGCVAAVALDGLVRGKLGDETYLRYLRGCAQGSADDAVSVLAFARSVVGIADGEAKCYSASPSPMRMDIVGNRALTRQEAEEVAGRLVSGSSLGVLVLSEGENPKGWWGHIMSLVGREGRILRVDGWLSPRRFVTEVTPRKAANIFRKGQRRKGLVIEI